MNIENTQSQMRKGILEFCILSIIRRGEAYPSDIVEEMRAANLNILEGTLYPLLTRLKNAEMLTYRWVESNSGPPRKYFFLLMTITYHPCDFPFAIFLLPDMNELKSSAILFTIF